MNPSLFWHEVLDEGAVCFSTASIVVAVCDDDIAGRVFVFYVFSAQPRVPFFA